jgi:hypothetical protein
MGKGQRGNGKGTLPNNMYAVLLLYPLPFALAYKSFLSHC